MSLAITAAPIENDNNQTYNETPVNRKRQANHNKTQRKNYIGQEDFNSEKVNSVLQSIHNKLPDEGNELCDYNHDVSNMRKINAPAMEEFKPLNPLAPPQSMGTERTKEGMTNIDNNSSSRFVPQPIQMEDMELQSLQSAFMNDSQVRDYYRKLAPNLDVLKEKINAKYPNSNSTNLSSSNYNYGVNETNQILIDKLNYMINLLEEKKDERTNNVTEEVILYSFLGIFIIFVVDSFARVGKYVR